jgi:hypothetical protein
MMTRFVSQSNLNTFQTWVPTYYFCPTRLLAPNSAAYLLSVTILEAMWPDGVLSLCVGEGHWILVCFPKQGPFQYATS